MTKTMMAALAVAMPMAAAGAQTARPLDPAAADLIAPLQITTTFQAPIAGAADAREVPATTAQDTARRMLYTMAANECAVLSEYWRADCRLRSFYVSGPLSPISGAGPTASSMYGTAIYELRLRSAGR